MKTGDSAWISMGIQCILFSGESKSNPMVQGLGSLQGKDTERAERPRNAPRSKLDKEARPRAL